MSASWWDASEQTGDSSVVRHSPDAHNYHLPDHEMLSKMRGSKVGSFATIPEANKDGTSKGFDPTVAGPVHVDPDAPDGGVIFDPTTVTNHEINKAISQSYYPHQAFYSLGTPAPLLGFRKGRMIRPPDPEQPRTNERLPGTYIIPKAKEDGGQYEESTVTANGIGQESSCNSVFKNQEEQHVAQPAQPFQQAQPIPQQPAPQQAYFPQMLPPPQLDPNVAALMQAMVGMQQQIATLTQRQIVQQSMPQTTGVSPIPLPQGPPPGLATIPIESRNHQRLRTRVGQPAYPGNEDFDDEQARPIRKQVVRDRRTQEIIEDDEDEQENESRRPIRRSRRNNSLIERDQEDRQQTVEDYEEAIEREKPRRGVIAGFETLNIPWVTGPVANKAKKVVFFEIPGAGKHSARYHDVVESEHCIALIYDTRYEDGTQYLPPDLGDEKIKLSCQSLKKTFSVSSMGFTVPFGVFDMIILIKLEVEDLNIED